MAISFVGVGTVANSTGAITPGLPAGLATNDLMLLVIETANQAITASGWNTAHAAQGQGSAGAAGAVMVTVLYRFYQPGDSDPTTSDSGNHQIGRIVAFRGVDTSTPFEDTDGQSNAASNTQAMPGITSSTAGAVAFYAVADDRDIATTGTQWRDDSWLATGVDGGAMTEVMDDFTSDGQGGGIGAAYGDVTTPTTLTSVSCRHSGGNSFASSIIGLILKPAAGAGAQSLTLPAISSATTPYAPTLAPGAVSVTLPHISGAAVLYAPTLAPAAVSVSLPFIAGSDSLYAPMLAAGAASVSIPFISSAAQLYAPTLTVGAVDMAVPFIASGAQLFAPSLSAGAVITLPFIASTATLYAPEVQPGAVTVTLPAIASGEAFCAPTLGLVVPPVYVGRRVPAQLLAGRPLSELYLGSRPFFEA